MNYSLHPKVTLALILSAATASAFADDLSLSLSTYAVTNPYKNAGTRTKVLPNINYEHDKFFIHGLTGGIHLIETQSQSLNFIALYSPYDYKPRYSDNAQMKKLDSRKATIMSGVSYDFRTESMGNFHAQLAADVLSRSKGLAGDLNYQYPIQTQYATVTPGVGTLWNSQKQNEYYYGISSSESARSGLSAYQPSSGFMPYAQVTALFPITQHLNVNLMGRYTLLPNTVQDSPMINKSGFATVGAGIGYHF